MLAMKQTAPARPTSRQSCSTVRQVNTRNMVRPGDEVCPFPNVWGRPSHLVNKPERFPFWLTASLPVISELSQLPTISSGKLTGALLSRISSQLGTTVDMDGVAGDPARIVGRQERHHAADIVRLSEAFHGLAAAHVIASLIALGEARHVGCDNARRYGVDADAARAKRG